LDRFYFVLTFVWFFVWYIAFLVETLDSEVNFYTDNLVVIVLEHIFVLIAPFIAYAILILVFKIFLWIIGGFRGTDAITPQTQVKIFASDGSFFNLVNKHRIFILGILFLFILIGVFISFMFTSYSSYEEKWNARSNLPNLQLPTLPKLPPLPKLPALPKLPSYVPFDER
jgi:hypothetical protein